VSPKQHKAT